LLFACSRFPLYKDEFFRFQATPIANTPSQHLPQSFFARLAEQVGPELIGCLLGQRYCSAMKVHNPIYPTALVFLYDCFHFLQPGCPNHLKFIQPVVLLYYKLLESISMLCSILALASRRLALYKFPILAGILIALPFPAQANLYRYTCKWKSQASPNAVISFSSTNGTGTYNGAMYYKGKRLVAFHEGSFQGYGSNWWSSSLDNESRLESVIQFFGNTPAGALHAQTRTSDDVKLLVVGLGSSLWYGNVPSWRKDSELLRAAEGFWIPSSGCRHTL